ncbi:MAG TPA: hypothetical protein VM717_13040 [Chthoniobacterales bacterium]|nr:hypothetical protein [Chthoniobacterales bacterium]
MHFGVHEIAAAISAGALIFCGSCEKHRLGEDLEVQKEHVDSAKGGEENPAAPSKEDVSNSATPNPTPAQFFPEGTPH